MADSLLFPDKCSLKHSHAIASVKCFAAMLGFQVSSNDRNTNKALIPGTARMQLHGTTVFKNTKIRIYLQTHTHTDTDTDTHTHTHRHTHTHTHTITPITYASKISKTPHKPDIELAISVLQLQMEQYINKKLEQLEDKVLKFITAVFTSTTTPEVNETTATALNSHSKKIFEKSIQIGKFCPSKDVYITSMKT